MVRIGGDKRDRTADLLNAIQALSQLSYTPKFDFFLQHYGNLELLIHKNRLEGAISGRLVTLPTVAPTLHEVRWRREIFLCGVAHRDDVPGLAIFQFLLKWEISINLCNIYEVTRKNNCVDSNSLIRRNVLQIARFDGPRIVVSRGRQRTTISEESTLNIYTKKQHTPILF